MRDWGCAAEYWLATTSPSDFMVRISNMADLQTVGTVCAAVAGAYSRKSDSRDRTIAQTVLMLRPPLLDCLACICNLARSVCHLFLRQEQCAD